MGQRSGFAGVILITAILLSAALLFSCGGRPNTGLAGPKGFVNKTQHTDAQLWVLWTAAQQTLSQRININPLQQQVSGAPAHLLPGDNRVWSILPHQLTLSAQPDISSPALLAATGMNRSDPTGLIVCPQPCNVQYAPAYSLYAQPATRYAASWENSGNNFDTLVQYEFENQILHALGYDMTWR